jgi:hypothetical protein
MQGMTSPSCLAGLRPPVLIIGAHRSGTTATARALSLLGLQIGQCLDSHDEPRQLQKVHENYLRQVGGAWHSPGPLIASFATSKGKQTCVQYLRDHLSHSLFVFGYDKSLTGWWKKRRLRRGAPWGWKEPRTTLFAPCWLEIFPEARLLHVVRNPLAVATSIQKRELEFQAKGDPPSGRVGDFHYCMELAMTYVEAGEALAAETRHFYRVRFEDIQANPISELTKLASFCDLAFSDRRMQRAAATIRPTKADTLQQVEEKRALLARYPLAAKLGYGVQ